MDFAGKWEIVGKIELVIFLLILCHFYLKEN